jgi:hypothetical protein
MADAVTIGNPSALGLSSFRVGQRVHKPNGTYTANGEIRAVFTTKDGQLRYVFEFDDPKGLLHIFNPDQLVKISEEHA